MTKTQPATTVDVNVPPKRNRYGSRFDPAVGEAPFYVGREVERLTAKQFAHAAEQLALTGKPLRTRTAQAAEAVLVHGLSYNQAAAKLGESHSYVRGAHLWTLERMRPYIEGGTNVVAVAPDLLLRGVPAALHAGIRERVTMMVEKYHAQQQPPAQHAPDQTPEQPLGQGVQ